MILNCGFSLRYWFIYLFLTSLRFKTVFRRVFTTDWCFVLDMAQSSNIQEFFSHLCWTWKLYGESANIQYSRIWQRGSDKSVIVLWSIIGETFIVFKCWNNRSKAFKLFRNTTGVERNFLKRHFLRHFFQKWVPLSGNSICFKPVWSHTYNTQRHGRCPNVFNLLSRSWVLLHMKNC